MTDLPHHLAATSAAVRRTRSGRSSSARMTAGSAAIAVVLLTSCSHSTGGTATSQHTATSTTVAASAPHTSATAAPAPPPMSDEDQAKATVTAFQDAYNSQNWEAYSELMCAAMRAKFTGVVMDYMKKGRIQNGPATIKSMTIAIDGDTATATMNVASEGLGPGTIKLPLKREDGWKVCQLR